MKRILPVAALIALMAAPPAAAAGRDAVITVYPDMVIGKVNPLIFGNSQIAIPGKEKYSDRGSGIWSPARLMPTPAVARPVKEYVELSKLAGITVHRWPGGAVAKNFNWKKTVGPLSERPAMRFGLPEFLAFCEATGAVSLITLAVEWGGPQDAADLVEYLNQPDNGANPNGGTDWAALRSADGHREPYGAVWFEYGNEEYGSTRKTPDNPEPQYIGPEEYAARFLLYQAAMKAIDPSIKLGGVLQYGEWTWTRKVLEGCGKQMDFAIEHTYVPNYKRNDDALKGPLLAQACTAADAAIRERYAWLNEEIGKITGRRDLPLAITEYNGHFVQEQPLPYRHTLANALRNAEHLRIMMQPESRIVMANFWLFANAYWGMVQGYTHLGERPAPQANFFPFQLYHEHFGDTLIKADVQCEKWEFAGAAGVSERKGLPRPFKLWEQNLLPQEYAWEGKKRFDTVKLVTEGRIVTAEFGGDDVNFAHARLKLPVDPSTGYRITGSIRTDGLIERDGVSFEIQDGRGWDATRSAATSEKVKGTSDWTSVRADYVTLPDAKEISIIARRVSGNGPISGKAAFRLESIQKFQPATAGAVPDLGVNSAKRKDGTVTVMIVNRNTEQPVPVKLKVAGGQPRESAAAAWMLSGDSCLEHNLKDPNAVGISRAGVSVKHDGYALLMPPCSMAAVEIRQ